MFRIVPMLLVACCTLSLSVTASATEVGDSVLAYWQPGKAYFVATVVQEQGSGFFVVFEDGDTALVPTTKVKPNDIKVGSSVIARWNDGDYYRGKVDKIVGRALYIHYADGDKRWVPWSWIAVQ